MAEKLVLNTMVLQVATEGLNTEVHWPGGNSGVTIGPGFDIGASAVKPSELRTILSKIGMPSSMVELLVLTTQEERKKAGITENPAVAADGKGLMSSLDLKNKVELTEQQSLDVGYIVKNRPGSSYQANVGNFFALSANILHPALREALVKIGYGSPAKLKSYGKEYDTRLSRTADPKEQAAIMVEMFSKARDTKQAEMDGYAKQLGIDPKDEKKLNTYNSQEGAGKSWFNARVTRDSARGMLYYVQQVKSVLDKGGEVVIEDKPMTVKELADPNNKNVEIMRRTAIATYSPTMSEASIVADIEKYRKKMEPIKNQQSKVDAELLQFCKDNLKQSTVYISPNDKKVQIMLKESGDYTGDIDGDFGKGSKAALDAYMKKSTTKFKSQAEAKEYLIKAYDNKFPPVKPNSNNNSGGNTNTNTNPNTNTDNGKSWWDKLMELYNAQTTHPQVKQESWWDKIAEYASSGWSAFTGFFTAGTDTISKLVDDAYKRYQQLLQQNTNTNNGGGGNTTNPDLETFKSAFAGKGAISASVGANGGKNNAKDVIIVRGLLFANKYLSENLQTVLGSKESRDKYSKSDAALEAAIRKFQSEKVGLAAPDGRVDAGGNTLNVLNGGKPKNQTNPNPQPNPQPQEEELNVAPVNPDAAVFGCFN